MRNFHQPASHFSSLVTPATPSLADAEIRRIQDVIDRHGIWHGQEMPGCLRAAAKRLLWKEYYAEDLTILNRALISAASVGSDGLVSSCFYQGAQLDASMMEEILSLDIPYKTLNVILERWQGVRKKLVDPYNEEAKQKRLFKSALNNPRHWLPLDSNGQASIDCVADLPTLSNCSKRELLAEALAKRNIPAVYYLLERGGEISKIASEYLKPGNPPEYLGRLIVSSKEERQKPEFRNTMLSGMEAELARASMEIKDIALELQDLRLQKTTLLENTQALWRKYNVADLSSLPLGALVEELRSVVKPAQDCYDAYRRASISSSRNKDLTGQSLLERLINLPRPLSKSLSITRTEDAVLFPDPALFEKFVKERINELFAWFESLHAASTKGSQNSNGSPYRSFLYAYGRLAGQKDSLSKNICLHGFRLISKLAYNDQRSLLWIKGDELERKLSQCRELVPGLESSLCLMQNEDLRHVKSS